MTSASPVGVTGSTGSVGGAVARLLAAAGVPLVLPVRDVSRAPDLPGARAVEVAGYLDDVALTAALDGVGTLLLVSGREAAGRVAEHVSAVDAAVAAGVRHVVYLSFLGAGPDCTFTFGRDHWHTEQHIRSAGTDFTFLRDNLYLGMVPLLVGEDGVVRGPAGDGRFGGVAQDDVAAVAATVLADPAAHSGVTYDLTGPESFSLAEAVAVLGDVCGREVRYERETEAEAYASRSGFGAPAFEVEGWVTSYTAIAHGDLDVVTTDVADVLGRPPVDLRTWLVHHPTSWERLRR